MTDSAAPLALVWFRRDLRLNDHPALHAALERGFRVLPVYIDDPAGEGDWPLGAASRAWLGRSLCALQQDCRRLGGDIHLCRGDSLQQLRGLAAVSGAQAVFWNRRYEPAVRQRDEAIKTALRGDGIEVHSFNGALLGEPWTIATQQGDPYRVFTPYWRRASTVLETLPPPLPAPNALNPSPLPAGETVQALCPLPRPRWDQGFWTLATPGEAGADQRVRDLLGKVERYQAERDLPAIDATSRLAAHLAFGEISPRQIVHALSEAGLREAAAGFIRELGWREFSYHLMFHFPHSVERDLTPQMQRFEWAPADPDLLAAWQQGRTGLPIIDAAMRELWHTGVMHNRCRMLVASLLTKNLRYHWRHGAAWFWDTLVDADLANNTQGWQWSAGTGADAAPYFRIFNPITQGERFDARGEYVRRWLPELAAVPDRYLHTPWEWPGLSRQVPVYPSRPRVDLASTRAEALAHYKSARS